MRMTQQSAMKRIMFSVILLLSLVGPWTGADAALVTYSFTGGVSQVNGGLMPTVNLMSPVSGTFQFDNSPATGGNYPGVVTNMTLAIGGYTSNYMAGANTVQVAKGIDLGGTFGDRWRLVTAATGLPINGYSPMRFDLNLDREGSLFANTDMQNPPSLSSLTGSRWRLIFENADGNLVRIQGSLSSLTAVPLPAAMILFGAGLISLVGLGAGGLRSFKGTQA
ncbi:conserved protein of unknown function [Nitrospira japonica]|uniref:Uncharacterized protein n=1 Tax=Nitrospira japonica TaxID=1325564 RepID=A0A1W1I9D9_9BACT|nr:hypothetical protein [Nitrospira japonica]SLM49616.1 conserved protein of unknown function [Nitrospira japonica]